MTKTILSLIAGFIVGILIIWGWNTYSNQSPNREVSATTTSPSNLNASTSTPVVVSDSGAITSTKVEFATESSNISVANQPSGSTVSITSFTLETDGWAVVHEEKNGFIANALGAVRRDEGQYTNITIPLLRDTQSDSRYWIVLYSDNGDRQFNLQTDSPLKDSLDSPITSSFKTQ